MGAFPPDGLVTLTQPHKIEVGALLPDMLVIVTNYL